MLNVSHVLDRNGIRSWNTTHAVADISWKINNAPDPIHMATRLFMDILSAPVKFTDAVQARIAAKHMIRDVITYKCVIDNDDVPDIIEQAMEYANDFCADSANSYLWSQPDSDTAPVQVTAQVVQDINIHVAIRDDGKIKKGGKQVLAAEMFKQYVIDAEKPLTNQEFIAVLMEKLDMKKLGATTYAYNCRKAHKEQNS